MVVTVAFLHQDQLFQTQLAEGQELSVGSHKKDSIQIPTFQPNQVVIKWRPMGICVQAKKAYRFERDALPLNTTIVLDYPTKTALYFSTLTAQSPEVLKLPYNGMLRFGRADTNDVVMQLPFISSTHFILRSEGGVVRVEDAGSTNGLYLNGRRITVAKLKSGDVLSIMSVQIRLLNGTLYFHNLGGNLRFRTPEDDAHNVTSHAQGQISHLKYRRSPRTQDRLPGEDILLAAAPSKGQKAEKGRGFFSSIAGSGAALAGGLLTTVTSPALLAAQAANMIAPLTNLVTGGAGKKRKKSPEQYEALRREKYGAYIADQKARIESVAKVQRDILNGENPSPAECRDILFGLRRKLWERMPADRDFLDVRMGMGYEELCVNVRSRAENNGFQMEDDETRELSEQIIEETRIVDHIPARLRLSRNSSVGIVGDRASAVRLVRNMLIALTTAHCFEDVRIVGIFEPTERAIWEPLKWLPHIWDENRQFRFLSFDRETAHNLCELLGEEVKRRRERSKEASNQSIPFAEPYYLLLFGSKDMVEREALLRDLFPNDPAMGITSIFLFDDMYLLPHDCKYIVDMDHGPCAFDRNEANKKLYFTPDPPTDDAQFDAFARRMAAVELDGFSKSVGLPAGITFLQGYGVQSVEQLDVLGRWKTSQPFKSLAAPIGVMNGGKTFALDIHEKVHGPHGLVAGTTGSGKSELLQTWILSMALTFHPQDVSFVIIDYKGGGMANLLEPLPHVVGKITNIGANIGRSLVSLQSELKRRLQVFEQYGVNHIDKYQRLYHAGKAKEPLPHLIIVADEFAELKKEEPEFMAGLISASRVGRSLGVHLVLATQKPGGVVDEQIRSNSRFRLCLKVQDVSDSREMIKRPDAAKLTQAGRSYFRVGEDEYFELFQSYWSGAPYFGAIDREEDVGNQVRIVDLSGRRIKTVFDEKTRFKSDLDELTAIVRYVRGVAEDNGIEKLQGPWLPELPETLTFETLPIRGGFDGTQWTEKPRWLSVPIGLYDAPKTQSQGLQWVDFAADGHYGIYGAPGTGKTTLLKTLVLALGTCYTPEDVNIYILDCGGWSMSVFADMPHVGGVALDGEEEKFRKFEKLILGEFERRKRVFLKNAVSSLTAYRETVCPDLPAIVVAIDNIVPIFDRYPALENLFVTIAREGAAYGIYMVFTANSTSGVRYKVLQNIRGAITFALTDKGDYAALVGRPEGMALPKVVGRAFIKGNPPVEFQAALFASGQNDRERLQNLREKLLRMHACWHGAMPKPIPVMPETVTAEMMLAEYRSRTSIPVGITQEELQTAYIELADNDCLLVSGPMRSGKSRMLLQMGELITARFGDTKLFVFDGSGASLAALKPAAHQYALCTDDGGVSAMLSELIECLNLRKRAQNQARQTEGAPFDEKAFIADYELLCIVIDDLKEYVDAVSDANKNAMERICRLAQNLGVIVLAAGRMADIAKYNEIESLTRGIVGNQNGIAVAGTPAQLSFFQNNLKYTERDAEAGEGNGYLFINGRCMRFKRMQ